MLTHRHTLLAGYLGYISQAIVVNLASLLFVTFNTEFGLTTEQITMLISFNFGTQVVVDLIAVRVIDRIGFRGPVVLAHVMAVVGLFLMALLPGVMDPYAGLLVATFCLGVGGGLIDVLVNPIVEALPGDEKASAMSLLHSFYSWGLMGVVLLSTAFFALAGAQHWRWLLMMWAIVPLFNAFLFAKVPIYRLVEESKRQSIRSLFKHKTFWILLLLMVCAGAMEQAMSQWASLFAELGLGVDKALGDLLGPCAFAVMMGLARTYYGIQGGKIKLRRAMMLSAALGIVSYLVTVFAPMPLLSLTGCAFTGLAVGLMWPGTLSLSSAVHPYGGGAMFGVLALAGAMGSVIGPELVGRVSGALERAGQGTEAGLRAGLLAATALPVLIIVALAVLSRGLGKHTATRA